MAIASHQGHISELGLSLDLANERFQILLITDPLQSKLRRDDHTQTANEVQLSNMMTTIMMTMKIMVMTMMRVGGGGR